MSYQKIIAQRALELLGPNGENWIKGLFALDANGEYVNYHSAKACKFCVLGAMSRVAATYGSEGNAECFMMVQEIARRNKLSIAEWNDRKERSFQDIKEALESFL